MGNNDRKMQIMDWDIWHVYSTFFIEEIMPLEEIAGLLVKYDFCNNIFSSEEEIFWKQGKNIYREAINIQKKGYERKAKVNLPYKKIDYNLEGFNQSFKMFFYESDIFNSIYFNSFTYIRCFLEPIYLYEQKSYKILYPQIKIYDNGVVLITYRVISSKKQISVDNFIPEYLNLYKHNFDSILLSPGLLKLIYRAFLLDEIVMGNFRGYKFGKKVNFVDEKIDSNSIVINEGDFTFNLTPIGTVLEYDVLNIDFLQGIITASLEYVLNKGKINKINRNKKGKYKFNIGNYWLGYPSVYLLKYKNQPEFSDSIIKKFGFSLSKLMARVSSIYFEETSNFFGKNLRAFKDYCVFINEALVLWVFSKKGLESDREFFDPNRGHLIYNKQVFIESILHFYLSCKRLEERSSYMIFSYKSLIKETLDIIDFYKNTEKISSKGELNCFYRKAINKLGFKQLKKYTDERLKTIAEISKENRINSYRKIGLALSIFFGLLSSTIITERITIPLWVHLNLWTPSQIEVYRDIFLFSITIIPIGILIYLIWKLIFKSNI